MRKRVKGFVALILSFMMCVGLVPIEVFAADYEIRYNTTEEVSTDMSGDTYRIYGSGGTLNVVSGGAIGEVTLEPESGCKAYLNVSAGGTVGTVTSYPNASNYEYCYITSSGSIGTINATGGEVTLNGGTVGTLNIGGGTLTASGENQVTNATLSVPVSGTGILDISGSLTYEATSVGTATIQVANTSPITTASDLSVSCDGVIYDILAGTTNKSIAELFGYSISDMALDFGTETEGYGMISDKTITITNTKINPIEIAVEYDTSYYGAVASVNDVGVDTSGFILNAGESAIISVSPILDLEAGTYDSVCHIIAMGEINEVSLNFLVETAPVEEPEESELLSGSGSAAISDYYYGGKPASPVISSSTNGVGHTMVQYKKYLASDSTYTSVAPTAVGDYTMRVTFAATDKYKEVVITDNFSVSYLPIPSNPYTVYGIKGENNFYITPARLVPADGYLVATELGGEYKEELYFNVSTFEGEIYFKKISTGEMSDALVISDILVDYFAPSINDIVDGETYYIDKMDISVFDANLKEVLVNDEASILMGSNATLQLSSNGGSTEYNIVATDYAGNDTTMTIILAAEWTKTGIIPSGERVRLNANTAYTLGAGSWKVSGDSTVYSGGTSFYVGGEGDYTFSNQ